MNNIDVKLRWLRICSKFFFAQLEFKLFAVLIMNMFDMCFEMMLMTKCFLTNLTMKCLNSFVNWPYMSHLIPLRSKWNATYFTFKWFYIAEHEQNSHGLLGFVSIQMMSGRSHIWRLSFSRGQYWYGSVNVVYRQIIFGRSHT
jgi:hypothetical protein